jgi:hypothetical protein
MAPIVSNRPKMYCRGRSADRADILDSFMHRHPDTPTPMNALALLEMPCLPSRLTARAMFSTR